MTIIEYCIFWDCASFSLNIAVYSTLFRHFFETPQLHSFKFPVMDLRLDITFVRYKTNLIGFGEIWTLCYVN
jgi:hypothetical protein